MLEWKVLPGEKHKGSVNSIYRYYSFNIARCYPTYMKLHMIASLIYAIESGNQNL